MKKWLKTAAAVALSTVLTVVPLASVTAEAFHYGEGYRYGKGCGNENSNDTMYLWHLVTSDTKPMYEYLTNGNADSEFRVLLAFKKAWSDDLAYYAADWTGIRYYNQGYGTSFVGAQENDMVDLGQNSFVSRGALRSFIVKSSGKHTAQDDYKNKYQYRFFYPDKEDKGIDVQNGGKVQLHWCSSFWGGDDWWAYDGKGSPCLNYSDEDECDESNNQKKYYDSDCIYQDFTLSYEDKKVSGKDAFIFTAVTNDDYDGQMFHYSITADLIGRNDSFGMDDKIPDSDASLQWLVYVGEPVGEPDRLLGSSDSITLNGETVVDKPSIITESQKYTISKGGTLYVRSILFMNGTIENHGRIVVADGGCILCYDRKKKTSSYQASIQCKGGDLYVMKRAFVETDRLLLSDSAELINHGGIMARGVLQVSDSIVDTESLSTNSTGILSYCGYGVCTRKGNLFRYENGQLSFVRSTEYEKQGTFGVTERKKELKGTNIIRGDIY